MVRTSHKGVTAAFSLMAALAATGFLAADIAPAKAAAPPPVAKDTRSPDPSLAMSGDFVGDPNHSRIVFSVNHNGFGNFEALIPLMDTALTLDAKDVSKSKLTATVHMDSVYTGAPATRILDAIKSEDMLSTEKFPTATYTATKIERTGDKTAKITGDLTFRGVTKPIVVDVTFLQAGEGPNPGYRIGFEGHTVIKRSDFGAVRLLPGIGDMVDLRIEAEFVPKTAAQ